MTEERQTMRAAGQRRPVHQTQTQQAQQDVQNANPAVVQVDPVATQQAAERGAAEIMPERQRSRQAVASAEADDTAVAREIERTVNLMKSSARSATKKAGEVIEAALEDYNAQHEEPQFTTNNPAE